MIQRLLPMEANLLPFLHDLRLLGPQQGVALTIDCSTMMLCKDDSSNFLRFEGIHLACYEVSSMIAEPNRSEVRVRWRTALLPMRRSATDGQWLTGPTYRDSVTTRFGRTSRSNVNIRVVDNVPVRVIKSTYDGGADLIHLLTLYDVANVDGCTTVVGAEPDPDWITLIISIRGVTGEIYKITPVRKVDIVSFWFFFR
ncbi:hypothetical protein ANCDUO_19779 [Ancylostoma duodenale]|uniref:Uncharacterized protein n=1 Tax=Ancylostoma duodenale TaxID=51022 RepID=A0A0C2FNH7_9BILA|nr:hypothetical protein ANCDUO_19779 [Ancylostoma duodenale]